MSLRYAKLINFVAFSEYMNFISYTSRPLVNSIEIEVVEEMSFYAFYNTRVRQVGIIVYG